MSKIIAQTIYQGTKVVMEVKPSLVYFKCKNEVFAFVKDAVYLGFEFSNSDYFKVEYH